MMGLSVTKYWEKHYSHEKTGCCTICGDWGIIDSRPITTPAGASVGKLLYCICPNGMALRKANAPKEQWRRK